MTYDAQDDTGVPVYLKELAPTELVIRENGVLKLFSQDSAEEFEKLKAMVYEDMWRLMKVQSRHLARILSVFRTSETVFIAVEKYPGQTLRQYVENLGGPVSEPFLRVFALGLIDALEKMHREGFVHRNISPDKVLVTPNGQPMLEPEFSTLGLNISRHDKTVSRMLSKANAYSAAEIFNEVDLQTPGSDIYSTAATMYFAITGKDPSSASTRIFKMARSEPDPNIKLSEMDSPINLAIRQGVENAMKVFQSNRYQNIEEWSRNLRLHASSTVVSTLPERKMSNLAPAQEAKVTPSENDAAPVAKSMGRTIYLILGVLLLLGLAASLFFLQ